MPVVLPDGTLSVFDNRTGLEEPPRVTHWRIDEKNMTATLVKAYEDPLAPSSPATGSARFSADGSLFVYWGDSYLMTEFSPERLNRISLVDRRDGLPRLSRPRRTGELSGFRPGHGREEHLLVLVQPVPHPTNRDDELGVLRIALDLLAEVRDVDVAGADVAGEL